MAKSSPFVWERTLQQDTCSAASTKRKRTLRCRRSCRYVKRAERHCRPRWRCVDCAPPPPPVPQPTNLTQLSWHTFFLVETTVPLSPTKNTSHVYKQCSQCPPDNPNRCIHPEVPTGTLTRPFCPPPPLPVHPEFDSFAQRQVCASTLLVLPFWLDPLTSTNTSRSLGTGCIVWYPTSFHPHPISPSPWIEVYRMLERCRPQ